MAAEVTSWTTATLSDAQTRAQRDTDEEEVIGVVIEEAGMTWMICMTIIESYWTLHVETRAQLHDTQLGLT